MDTDYYFHILSVISVVYNSFLCKENPFFIFFYFNQWSFNKNQVILILIKINDLNPVDLNRPTPLVRSRHLSSTQLLWWCVTYYNIIQLTLKCHLCRWSWWALTSLWNKMKDHNQNTIIWIIKDDISYISIP